jgi:hypothetical protein
MIGFGLVAEMHSAAFARLSSLLTFPFTFFAGNFPGLCKRNADKRISTLPISEKWG